MGHQAGEGEREVGVAVPRGQAGHGRPVRRRRFPQAPVVCGASAHRGIRVEQQSRVRVDDVDVVLNVRDAGAEPRPSLGEQGRDAAAEEPIGL